MDNCPKCNSSWIGDEIPKDIAHHYSSTHWSREIGIDGGIMGIYDGLVALRCPDCNEYVPVSNNPWHEKMFKQFMEKMQNESNS